MRLISLLTSLLIFYNCAIQQLPLTQTNEEFIFEIGQRWIDYDDLIKLMNYGSTESVVKTQDVLNYIGEPVYLEQLSVNDEKLTLFWYQYKLKYFPVRKKEIAITEREDGFYKKTEVIKDFYQIKPPSTGTYEKWEEGGRWLLVVIAENYHEIILTDIAFDKDPKFEKDYFIRLKELEKD